MPYKDKNKQREYQRLRVAKRRSDWFQENGPCKECNSWENLEVDHINSSLKTMNPAAIWSRSEEVRNKELAKCQVLCHDCHVLKTIECKDSSHGENHYKSILNDKQVLWLRKQYLNNVKFTEMSKELKISPDTARQAVRKGWTHLEIGPIPTKTA